MAEGFTTGDLEPPLCGTLLGKVRGDHGDLTDAEFTALAPYPIDLTAAELVTVHIKRQDGTILTKEAVQGDQKTSPGSWSTAWEDDDLTVAGKHVIEVQVTWPGVRPQTFGPAFFKVVSAIA